MKLAGFFTITNGYNANELRMCSKLKRYVEKNKRNAFWLTPKQLSFFIEHVNARSHFALAETMTNFTPHKKHVEEELATVLQTF
jgi:hypothetical protein